jgi:hypothetical protein
MNHLNDGDILMYLDCGCELDIEEKTYLDFYIETVKKDKIIGCNTFCLEQEWNKSDVIHLLDMNDSPHLQTFQHEAGALLIFVCPETRALVDQWYDVSCTYHNIDDTPSILPESEIFKEHRHDQSVFSLLCKKYDTEILDDETFYWPGTKEDKKNYWWLLLLLGLGAGLYIFKKKKK